MATMDTDTVTVAVTLTKYEWERVTHALFCYKVDALTSGEKWSAAVYKCYADILRTVEEQVGNAQTV